MVASPILQLVPYGEPGNQRLGFWGLGALAPTPVSNDHNRPRRSVRGDDEPELSPMGHHEVDRAKATRE